MTKDELLNVPVVEKEKKVKKEASDDAFLSTFTNAEKKIEEVVSKEENKVESVEVETVSETPKAVDADGDFFIDEDPGLFAEEMKEETEDAIEDNSETVTKEVKVETVEEITTENVEKTKEEAKVESEDTGINSVVKAAEEKVAQKAQDDGKNIELANNIVKESKIEENRNLPADVKPYLEIIKEKLKGAGRVVMNVLEMVGDLVENIFKKKN